VWNLPQINENKLKGKKKRRKKEGRKERKDKKTLILLPAVAVSAF